MDAREPSSAGPDASDDTARLRAAAPVMLAWYRHLVERLQVLQEKNLAEGSQWLARESSALLGSEKEESSFEDVKREVGFWCKIALPTILEAFAGPLLAIASQVHVPTFGPVTGLPGWSSYLLAALGGVLLGMEVIRQAIDAVVSFLRWLWGKYRSRSPPGPPGPVPQPMPIDFVWLEFKEDPAAVQALYSGPVSILANCLGGWLVASSTWGLIVSIGAAALGIMGAVWCDAKVLRPRFQNPSMVDNPEDPYDLSSDDPKLRQDSLEKLQRACRFPVLYGGPKLFGAAITVGSLVAAAMQAHREAQSGSNPQEMFDNYWKASLVPSVPNYIALPFAFGRLAKALILRRMGMVVFQADLVRFDRDAEFPPTTWRDPTALDKFLAVNEFIDRELSSIVSKASPFETALCGTSNLAKDLEEEIPGQSGEPSMLASLETRSRGDDLGRELRRRK